MNANELADWLDEYGTDRDEKAATMLRQQQAEIEALKQQLVTTSSEAKWNYNKGYEDGRKLATVKELTDEEMMKVEYEFLTWNRSLDKPLVEISYELGVFKQAVEILRKASEK